MKLIAAVDKNWGIGNQGKLLVNIPMDQKQFQTLTMGRIIIMGRKTFEGLPQSQPLAGRINVVFTRNQSFQPKGVKVVHSMEECDALLDDYRSRGVKDDDIFVIGGEQIYKLFLPKCDTAIITEIDYEYQADAHIPDLSKSAQWKLVDESDEMTYFDLEFYFRKYVRV